MAVRAIGSHDCCLDVPTVQPPVHTRERYVLLRSNRIFADTVVMSDCLREAYDYSISGSRAP
jgi:hypothetical protein